MTIATPPFLAGTGIRLTPVEYGTTLVDDTQPTAADIARIAAAEAKRRRKALKRSKGATS